MAAWLKTKRVKINLDKMLFMQKVSMAPNVGLKIILSYDTSVTIPVADLETAEQLGELIIKTINSGSDAVLDAIAFEKV